MAEAARVDIDGATRVVASLGAVARDLGNLAPPEAGRLIQGRARAAAPFVSGALRTSLAVDTEDGRVSVGSPLPYAHVIHNGWAAHNIRANPFLIPVAEDSESVWGPAYVVETNRIVRTEMKGA